MTSKQLVSKHTASAFADEVKRPRKLVPDDFPVDEDLLAKLADFTAFVRHVNLNLGQGFNCSHRYLPAVHAFRAWVRPSALFL